MTRPSSSPAVIQAAGVCHSYGQGGMRRQVLQGISLTIQPGEVVLLTGPSGCGKTTLLTLIGALRSVQEGQLDVLGVPLRGASASQRRRVRRRIGMIFQGHNLLRCLTAEQNVQMGADLLPQRSYGTRRALARNRRATKKRTRRRRTRRRRRRAPPPSARAGGRVPTARASTPRPRRPAGDRLAARTFSREDDRR